MSNSTAEEERLLLLTPQGHWIRSRRDHVRTAGWGGRGVRGAGILGISSDESVDDEGQIQPLLSKGLKESPREVTACCFKGMLAQPRLPEGRVIGHRAY